ncbi:MAG: magnesium transporter [Nitrospinales bacterium]
MPIDKIKNILTDPSISSDQVGNFLSEMDHFEIARLMHQLDVEEKVTLFKSLKPELKQQELLYETDFDSRREIIQSLDNEFMADFLEGMPEDEATDILKELPPSTQEQILQGMVPKDAYAIKNLISYEEETAGGMMNSQFNKIAKDQTAGNILLKVKNEPANEHIPYYFVVDEKSILLGFFKLRDLLKVSANVKAEDFMRKDPPKAKLNDPCEKIANLMDHESLSALPVVDDHGIIKGIVTFDDVIRVVQDTASEDIYTMVGTAKVDPFAKKTIKKVITRAPWLLTTFIGGLISAWILQVFKITITDFTTVILFIPFVLGLAGNVGIQGGTVIVRGLATGDIQTDNIKTVVISEIQVGLINGIIFGSLCGVVVSTMNHFYIQSLSMLGVTVGLGIVLAVAMASILGTFTPFIFYKMNIDPAISTGPVITVINDILGLFIYLSTSVLLI